MNNPLKSIWTYILDVLKKWSEDKAPKLGAALAFYTVFSIAPLLMIAIAIVGIIFGPEAAQGKIVGQLNGVVGTDAAGFIQTALKNSANKATNILAGIASIVVLILGATAVFIELQDSLNIIWRVRTKPGLNAVRTFLKTRLISFSLIVAIGGLILAFLIVSALISALNDYLAYHFFSMPVWSIQLINNLITLSVIFILFIMVYKILPDAEIRLKDVWVGSLISAILFTIGKYFIGLYLGSSTLGSTYGAAGSLAIFLMWVYYSAQIIFLGAEFTQVYVQKYGAGTIPTKNAVSIDEYQMLTKKQGG